MNILEELWYGNLDPAEYDTSPTDEYKELVRLISRNEEKLLAMMTDSQKELFLRYTDCVREYQAMAECLLFQRSFQLGAKIMLEVMHQTKGRLDAPGRPMLYGTTSDFLRAFGLTSIDALPQTAEEIKEMFARMDGAEEEADANEQLTISDEFLSIVDTKSDDRTTEENENAEQVVTNEIGYEDESSAEDDIIIDM